jgi:uncharacterized membrane protein YkvA (DUF1232 family)
VRALLVVPDVFMLLVRLALDPEVPGGTRALIGGALAYFVLPVDLLPEAMLGPAGYLEDLVLASAVLAQAFGGELEEYAEKYWSGRQELRVVLRDVTNTAHAMLGENVYRRLERLLERRGVRLPAETPRPRRLRAAEPEQEGWIEAEAEASDEEQAPPQRVREARREAAPEASPRPAPKPVRSGAEPPTAPSELGTLGERARVQVADPEGGRRQPYEPDLDNLSPDDLLEHGEEHA